MEKFNNEETVFFYAVILMVLEVLLGFSGAFLFLLKPLPSYLPFSLICALGFILVFYVSLNIKTFKYENSMQFISIKQSYFWKLNRSISPIEFPNKKLVGFGVSKVFFHISLMLLIQSKNKKTKKIYCNIIWLSKAQIAALKLSLQNAKEYDEDWY